MITSASRVKLIVALGLIAMVSVVFIFVYSYNYKVYVYIADFTFGSGLEPSPVDQWLGMGFERSKLEDDHSNKSVSEEEYQNLLKRLVAQETKIAKYYPRNMIEYKTYTVNKSTDQKHPVEFWIAIFTALIAGIGSISGMVIAWKNDRRAAIDTELKILELQSKFNTHQEGA